jgi:hypothetical protein
VPGRLRGQHARGVGRVRRVGGGLHGRGTLLAVPSCCRLRSAAGGPARGRAVLQACGRRHAARARIVSITRGSLPLKAGPWLPYQRTQGAASSQRAHCEGFRTTDPACFQMDAGATPPNGAYRVRHPPGGTGPGPGDGGRGLSARGSAASSRAGLGRSWRCRSKMGGRCSTCARAPGRTSDGHAHAACVHTAGGSAGRHACWHWPPHSHHALAAPRSLHGRQREPPAPRLLHGRQGPPALRTLMAVCTAYTAGSAGRIVGPEMGGPGLPPGRCGATRPNTRNADPATRRRAPAPSAPTRACLRRRTRANLFAPP